MSNRQLGLLIFLVVVLSLTLAWLIERTQVRTFMGEFEQWWEDRTGGTTEPPADGS